MNFKTNKLKKKKKETNEQDQTKSLYTYTYKYNELRRIIKERMKVIRLILPWFRSRECIDPSILTSSCLLPSVSRFFWFRINSCAFERAVSVFHGVGIMRLWSSRRRTKRHNIWTEPPPTFDHQQRRSSIAGQIYSESTFAIHTEHGYATSDCVRCRTTLTRNRAEEEWKKESTEFLRHTRHPFRRIEEDTRVVWIFKLYLPY